MGLSRGFLFFAAAFVVICILFPIQPYSQSLSPSRQNQLSRKRPSSTTLVKISIIAPTVRVQNAVKPQQRKPEKTTNNQHKDVL
mmetsp:Transcript_14931/g.32258  ORF Transcript_14931/g.32258 Transcript_14931/m.32258 type:complete len:84 (+) Transcript_14931:110-361(+)